MKILQASRLRIVAAAVATFTFALGVAEAQEIKSDQFLSMGTSSAGSTWFPLGGAMAGVITKANPRVKVNIEATGGNVENVRLIGNKKIELALISSDQAYLAYHGEGPYQGKKISNFKGLLGGGAIIWQSYTLRKTGITSLADLKGKRVSLGAPGSIGNSVGELILKSYGLEVRKDWSPEYLSHGEGPGALKDGRVDAVVIIGPVPTGPLTDLTSSHGSDVIFLNPAAEKLAELRSTRPYWTPVEIPGGIYKGHDRATPNSFGVSTILIAEESMPDEVAYAITKALLENQAELRAGHALGREWVPETAARGIKGVIPFHPGSEKYLKEKGLL